MSTKRKVEKLSCLILCALLTYFRVLSSYLPMEIKKIPYTATWPIRQQVMWPDKPLDYIKIPGDETAVHLGLFVEDQLVSIVSVFIQGQEAQFRKFATLQKEQGKGYGSRLLTQLFAQFQQEQIHRIWCNARREKAHFYARFGMIETQQTFSKGGIDYVIMEKRS